MFVTNRHVARSVLLSCVLAGCADDSSGGSDGSGSSSGSTSSGSGETADVTTISGSSTDSTTSGSSSTTDPTTTTDATTGTSGSTGEPTGGTDSTGGTGSTGGTAGTGGDDGQVVWFHGDFVTNNAEAVGRADFPDGTPAELSLTGFGGATVDAIAVSPDGSQLAVGMVDASGDPVLAVYASDGSGSPTTLFTGLATTAFVQIGFSPDGDSIAFIADGTLDGENELYVVPTAGNSAASQLTGTSNDIALDVDIFAWSRDGSRLAFIGDIETNNADGIWAVDPAVGIASQVALYPTGSLALDNRVRSNMVDFDAAGRAYFVFEASDGSFTLYRVDDDGMNLQAVPGTDLTNGDGDASVVSFGINDDGDRVAFAADSPQAGVFEVWVVGTAQMVADRVSDVSPANLSDTGPVPTHPIVWSPDGTQLAVISDWVVGGSVSGDDAVWLVPSSTPAGGTRILAPDANNNAQDATNVDFSADGMRLFVLGDLLDNNDDELYQTTDLTTADQAPGGALLQDAPVGGDLAGFATDR